MPWLRTSLRWPEPKDGPPKRVWVVVLGDFGRSPRMEYHALSLARQAKLSVEVIAEGGSKPLKEFGEEDKITIHTICEPPKWLAILPRAIALVLKAIFQVAALIYTMSNAPPPDIVFLQVPPAIPTLFICFCASRFHGARFIIDWHNFAYTLMALKMGNTPTLVKLARKFERYWGRQADQHICVSNAMADVLKRDWGIEAMVFFDKPPAHFRKASLDEQHNLLIKYRDDIQKPMHPHDFVLHDKACDVGAGDPAQTSSRVASTSGGEECKEEETIATRLLRPSSAGTPSTSQPSTALTRLRSDRPGLIVSSTSWTPDEDFGLLLYAATLYDKQAEDVDQGLPKLLILVTGKGPMKEAFEKKMRALDLKHVAFRTLWLEAEDYPLLLGSCDLGVCLHKSSSGVDLPMKVVDMFGCGLPVCAFDYNTIQELVAPNRSGVLFKSGLELARHLASLFRGFPHHKGHLVEMQKLVTKRVCVGWNECWEARMLPLFCNPRPRQLKQRPGPKAATWWSWLQPGSWFSHARA